MPKLLPLFFCAIVAAAAAAEPVALADQGRVTRGAKRTAKKGEQSARHRSVHVRRTRRAPGRDAMQRGNQPRSLDHRAYPYLAKKYRRAIGSDRGTYRGVGNDGKTRYQLPRRVDPRLDGTRLAEKFPRRFESARQLKRRGIEPGSMDERAFLTMLERATPRRVLDKIDRVIDQAIAAGEAGTARRFPIRERKKVRYALMYSYLHSRDMTVVMSALGYPLEATGKHDMDEFAPAEEVKKVAKRAGTAAWLKRYAARLRPGTKVNIGFMNPHLLADIWKWTPEKGARQDAMDLHRLSDHHGGHKGAWDPIEAAVNNVFHQREHRYGVRKAASLSWLDLGHKLATAEGAAKIAKSEIGAPIVKDASKLMHALERQGKITPWYLVNSEAW